MGKGISEMISLSILDFVNVEVSETTVAKAELFDFHQEKS